MIASQTLLSAGLAADVYHAHPTYGREVAVEVFLCNQDAAHWSDIDVAITQDQSATLPEQYLYRGYSMSPTKTKVLKLSLREGDIIRVMAGTSKVSVVVMTEEIVTPQTIEMLSERVDNVTQEVQRLAETLAVSA